MVDNTYDQLDDLFTKIRLRLAVIRQSDPLVADEIKELLTQLELWVESLVVSSLKQTSKVSGRDGVKKSPNSPRKQVGGK